MIDVNERVDEELELLRNWFITNLDFNPDGNWIRIREYHIPSDLWVPPVVEVAFQIPEGIPGQAPYGFHVRPVLDLTHGGKINNYTAPTSNPWGDGWGTFSWQLQEWVPGATARDGTNMVDFARSFADRFREGA